MRALRPLLALFAIAAFALPAGAAVIQPGETRPVPWNDNLKNYLAGEGETIDPVTAAATEPTTFNPNCQLTFKVIARGGGQRNSFGWYNVTGSKPERSDLHEFLGCSDGVGTEKVLDIKNHPAYRGGRIGFFMATTEGKTGKEGNCVRFDRNGVNPDPATLGHLYYSESQYNDDNRGENSFIHLLILDSGVYPQAFYFGWEDLFGGGDNDFEDLLTRVEGITCAGGGGACDTGLKGICGAGTMQCQSGALTCLPEMKPRGETCNGLDDDCDGLVDNGDDLCGTGEVCDRGRCVAGCLGGEFGCFGGLVCNDRGFCVEPACADVECPTGEVCVGGTCKAPCDGIECPLGQVCRVGACVDPCDGIVCDAGQVCDGGVCKANCDCAPCAEGAVCSTSGACVDEGCDQQSCDEGQVCMGGNCVDACEGAVCPEGQVCQRGACVDEGSVGEGGSGSGSGGSGGSGAGGAGGNGSGGSGSGSGGNGNGGKKKSGGGCSAAEGAFSLVGILAAAPLLRRKR